MGSLVLLSSEDSHHIRDVLRLEVDGAIEVGIVASGKTFIGSITSLLPFVEVRLDSPLKPTDEGPDQGEDGPKISLLFALCKGERNDSIADWGTELGCSAITFWQSDRSVVRLRTASDVLAKQSRLQKISLAAAKQSRQDVPPRVTVADSLISALHAVEISSAEVPNEQLRLCCSLSSKASPLTEVRKLSPYAPLVHLVIGPEGDLTPNEENMLQEHGFHLVGLGKRVLRAELAAVAAVLATRITFSV